MASPVDLLVADPALARLWQGAHRRLEATGGELAGVRIMVTRPSDDERIAIGQILGKRLSGTDIRVSAEELDDVLRRRAGASVSDLVVAAVGPWRDRPAARTALAAAEHALWDQLAAHSAIQCHPDLAQWLEQVRSTGRWKHTAEFEPSILKALDIVAELPRDSPLARQGLAAELCGDAHALDDDRPVGRLSLSALAYLAGHDVRRLRSADRRALWEQAGVVVDGLSSQVLVAGLRPTGTGTRARAVRQWAESGSPFVLTLDAIVTEEWFIADAKAYVCENPSVLSAAAGELATACPPIICVAGRPSVAATKLLTALHASSCELKYHGDFGGGGVAIANQVICELGATPWRFRSEDHRRHLERLADRLEQCPPLTGGVPDAGWDTELAASIRACGIEIEEELVLDELIADLTEASNQS